MFYVATSRGFLASAEWKTFHQDIRMAQLFPTFAEANQAAKALKLKGPLQHWCILTPSPWETKEPSQEPSQEQEPTFPVGEDSAIQGLTPSAQ